MSTPSPNQANPYAPPRAEVRDNVVQNDTEMELAGRGARLGAWLLDTLTSGILISPMFMGIDMKAMASAASSGAYSAEFWNAFSATGLMLGAIGFAIWLAITAYLVHKNSQTIGKKIVGIKVVRSDFSPASFARIFWLRNIVNVLPSLIPFLGKLYGLVDHLFIFTDRRQCVHDKIADTVVVKA